MVELVRNDLLSLAPLMPWSRPGRGGEIDVYETDVAVVAQVSVPGVRPEQINVQEHDGVLTVRVERAEAALRNGLLTIRLPKAASSSVRRIPFNRAQPARAQSNWLARLGMNGGVYWFSDKLALHMAGARELSYGEAAWLHQLVAGLARQANLPMPRVYVVDSDAPNAFATGRSPRHGAVAVTTGLLHLLNRDELAAVIAHELGHIKNRDTLISAVVATIAGAITMLADMAQWALLFGGFGGSDEREEDGGLAGTIGELVMVLIAPIAATLIQLAISRTREFGADAASARITGEPLALASALHKLEAWKKHLPQSINPATAHLYIVNPLDAGAIAGLFSTHPPVEQRIARLEQLAFGRRVLV